MRKERAILLTTSGECTEYRADLSSHLNVSPDVKAAILAVVIVKVGALLPKMKMP